MRSGVTCWVIASPNTHFVHNRTELYIHFLGEYLGRLSTLLCIAWTTYGYDITHYIVATKMDGHEMIEIEYSWLPSTEGASPTKSVKQGEPVVNGYV